MLEKFTYTNHMNEVLEFGKDSLYVNENDLRDFAWDITSKNDRISDFKKGIVSKTIPVILKCNSEAEGLIMRNRLFEVFEKDVLARKHGRLQIGDYYLRCYVTGSKKTQYLISKEYMLVTLTVQTDHAEWIKETTTNYDARVNDSSTHLDYPYDYEFDYKNGFAEMDVNNTSLIASNFILTISGYVDNPTIYIGEHEYAVNVRVEAGEYLTINSADKTIVLTKNDGKQVNCFNQRNKDSYVFEKIPVGDNPIIAASSSLQFSITLLEERSEPTWI